MKNMKSLVFYLMAGLVTRRKLLKQGDDSVTGKGTARRVVWGLTTDDTNRGRS